MTRDELWRIIITRNPRFKNDSFEMTPALLRKLYNLAWEQATNQVVQPLRSDVPDFLQDLFGKDGNK